MTTLDPQTIKTNMETTTGAEQDFWYDRWLDLQSEYDDQNNAALELMNEGGR